MKQLKTIGSLVAVVLLGAQMVAMADVQVGKKAPDFQGLASDGKTYRLADLKGKFVVLEWFNKGCPFVKKHYQSGNMQKLQDLYTKKGVVWLSVGSSAFEKEGYMERQEAEQYRKKNGVHSTALLLDAEGTIGHLYGAKTTPHMFVIDPKGVLIYAGAIDDHNSADESDIPQSKNYVALALDQAMAGKPVAASSTHPYGCSVKY